MTEAGHAVLRALRDLDAVTVEPPAADAEPDEIVTRAGQVLAAREKPLRDLAAALEPDPTVLRGLDGAAALRAGIEQRAAAWHAALAHARHLVGERIQAVSHMRRTAYR
jgi:hypothetical protein